MHAVVLVGGFGTRLRPLTDSIPKPMLPVGHRPMIARLIDRLARGGVTDVVLALGFRPEPFIAAFPDGKCGDVTLTYAVEPQPLDTGGAIKFAAEYAGIDDTFVVANGDVLTDLDVGALIAAHRRWSAEATLHLIGVEDPSAFGVVEMDGDRIVDFVEKPSPGTEPSNLINAGTYVFEPMVLDRIPAGEPVSIERATFPLVVAAGAMYGLSTADYWLDAGRPELYRAANLDLLDGARRVETCIPVAASADVADSASIVNSIVGEHAIVGERAHIEDSVVLPGASIGADANVAESLVMGHVGAGATLRRAVVGADGRVNSGESLVDASLPAPAVG